MTILPSAYAAAASCMSMALCALSIQSGNRLRLFSALCAPPVLRSVQARVCTRSVAPWARAYFERESEQGNDVALRATAALLHHSSTQVTEHYLGLNHEKVRRDRSGPPGTRVES